MGNWALDGQSMFFILSVCAGVEEFADERPASMGTEVHSYGSTNL